LNIHNLADAMPAIENMIRESKTKSYFMTKELLNMAVSKGNVPVPLEIDRAKLKQFVQLKNREKAIEGHSFKEPAPKKSRIIKASLESFINDDKIVIDGLPNDGNSNRRNRTPNLKQSADNIFIDGEEVSINNHFKAIYSSREASLVRGPRVQFRIKSVKESETSLHRSQAPAQLSKNQLPRTEPALISKSQAKLPFFIDHEMFKKAQKKSRLITKNKESFHRVISVIDYEKNYEPLIETQIQKERLFFLAPETARQKEDAKRREDIIKRFIDTLYQLKKRVETVEMQKYNQFSRYEIIRNPSLAERLTKYTNSLEQQQSQQQEVLLKKGMSSISRFVKPTLARQQSVILASKEMEQKSAFKSTLEALKNLMADDIFRDYEAEVLKLIDAKSKPPKFPYSSAEERLIPLEKDQPVIEVIERYELRKSWREKIKRALQCFSNTRRSDAALPLQMRTFIDFASALKLKSPSPRQTEDSKQLEQFLAEALKQTNELHMSIHFSPNASHSKANLLDRNASKSLKDRFASPDGNKSSRSAKLRKTTSIQDFGLLAVQKSTAEFIEYCKDSIKETQKDNQDLYQKHSRMKYFKSSRKAGSIRKKNRILGFLNRDV